MRDNHPFTELRPHIDKGYDSLAYVHFTSDINLRSSVSDIDFYKITIWFNHKSNHTEYYVVNRYDEYHHCLKVHPYTILKEPFQLPSSAFNAYHRSEPDATVIIGPHSLHMPSAIF